MDKQQIRKDYTIEIDENGMLTSVSIEEINGMGRWVYKRDDCLLRVFARCGQPPQAEHAA